MDTTLHTAKIINITVIRVNILTLLKWSIDQDRWYNKLQYQNLEKQENINYFLNTVFLEK